MPRSPDRSVPCSTRLTMPRRSIRCPYACSLCGSCADVCPVKIPLDQQLLHLRGEIAAQGYLPLSETTADEADQLRDAAYVAVQLVRANGAVVGAQAAAIPDLQPTQRVGQAARDYRNSPRRVFENSTRANNAMDSKSQILNTLSQGPGTGDRLAVAGRALVDVCRPARPVSRGAGRRGRASPRRAA